MIEFCIYKQIMYQASDYVPKLRMSSSANSEYVGGCCCSKFRYKFSHPTLEDGTATVDRCNCRFCEQKGALWMYIN